MEDDDLVATEVEELECSFSNDLDFGRSTGLKLEASVVVVARGRGGRLVGVLMEARRRGNDPVVDDDGDDGERETGL